MNSYIKNGSVLSQGSSVCIHDQKRVFLTWVPRQTPVQTVVTLLQTPLCLQGGSSFLEECAAVLAPNCFMFCYEGLTCVSWEFCFFLLFVSVCGGRGDFFLLLLFWDILQWITTSFPFCESHWHNTVVGRA